MNIISSLQRISSKFYVYLWEWIIQSSPPPQTEPTNSRNKITAELNSTHICMDVTNSTADWLQRVKWWWEISHYKTNCSRNKASLSLAYHRYSRTVCSLQLTTHNTQQPLISATCWCMFIYLTAVAAVPSDAFPFSFYRIQKDKHASFCLPAVAVKLKVPLWKGAGRTSYQRLHEWRKVGCFDFLANGTIAVPLESRDSQSEMFHSGQDGSSTCVKCLWSR